MSSRKRQFEESDNSSSEPILPPPKKQKLLNDYFYTSTFQNSTDHNQFVFYFNIIQKNQLIQSLNIPSIINREIAEYATGTIKPCSNLNCNEGICILNSDWKNFNKNKITKWTYCDRKNNYFCEKCKPHTLYFNCCDTTQCILNSKKCDFLTYDKDKTKTMCYDRVKDTYLMGYKCLYCNYDENGICPDCGEWSCKYDRIKCDNNQHNFCCSLMGICNKCNARFCNKCTDDNYNAEFADFCCNCPKLFCGDCVCDMMKCEGCYGSFCEDCMNKQKNDVSCDICSEWWCEKCVQQKNIITKYCDECDNTSCNQKDTWENCEVFGNCIECKNNVCNICDGKVCFKCSKMYCQACMDNKNRGLICDKCEKLTCNDCNESVFKGCCSNCTTGYWKYVRVDILVKWIKEWNENNTEINRRFMEEKLIQKYNGLSHEFLQVNAMLQEAIKIVTSDIQMPS
eukprot:108824_1